jgi:hypothetical protein
MKNRYFGFLSTLLACGCCFCATRCAYGQSAIVSPLGNYTAVDRLTDLAPEAFGTFGNYLACLEKSTGLQVVDPTSGSVRYSLGSPTDGYYSSSVWSSFVTADPSGSSLWVGFTKYGNTDDRIYQVDLNGNWTHKTSLIGNFDMEFHGTTAYISANTSGLNAGNNFLWKFDTTASSLLEIASVGGYSAGVGVDSKGNVYYGNYGYTVGSQSLYRFSEQQISNAISQGTVLGLSDATILATFADSNGPYDLDVDTADNVVFDLNSVDGYGSKVAVWNGVEGSGANYNVIGTGSGQDRWYTMLETSENILANGGKIYVQDYFNPGIAEMTNVTTPEPSTFILLSIAAITGAIWRCKRRRHSLATTISTK